MPQSQRLPPWPDLAPLGPIFDAAKIVGLFEWNVEEDRIFPCLGMARIFGLDLATIREGAPSAEFASVLHPQDRTAFANRAVQSQTTVEQTIYRVAPAGQATARTILDVTHLSVGPRGVPDWACGALFDYPGATSVTATLARSHSVLAALDRAAGLAIDLRHAIQDIRNPTLNTLVDMVLVEIASSLARQMDLPDTQRLN